MPLQKILSFGKLLALLLLISYSAAAKPIAQNGCNEKRALSLNKTDQSFHKNMLQPQVAHLSVASEDSVKPISSGYAALFFYENTSSKVQSAGQTHQTLQDVDRCESVSMLLFPFHYFW